MPTRSGPDGALTVAGRTPRTTRGARPTRRCDGSRARRGIGGRGRSARRRSRRTRCGAPTSSAAAPAAPQAPCRAPAHRALWCRTSTPAPTPSEPCRASPLTPVSWHGSLPPPRSTPSHTATAREEKDQPEPATSGRPWTQDQAPEPCPSPTSPLPSKSFSPADSTEQEPACAPDNHHQTGCA